MALSFPWPVIGTTIRARGQGCTACVHRTYCPALYWNTRWNDYQPTPDHGKACTSWSNDMATQIGAVTAEDIAANALRSREGVLAEANRSGITDAVTGSNREPTW